MDKIKLNDYIEKIQTSQHGEDGMLKKAFEVLQINKGYFIDIGGWDGIKYSNCYNLVLNGWDGLYVECNQNKHKECIQNMSKYPGVKSCLTRVSLKKGETLNDIFYKHNIVEGTIDLLNIDIDSYDYWIWANLKKYSPKVVIIEYANVWMKKLNFIDVPQTIKYDLAYRYKKPYIGANSEAFIRLADYKDYDLIGQTRCNLIFINRGLTDSFEILEKPKDNSSIKPDKYGVWVKYSQLKC